MLQNPWVRTYAVPSLQKSCAEQTAMPLPSRRHSFIALSRSLASVAWCTSQEDIAGVEQLAAVTQLDNVVAIDLLPSAVVRRLTRWILATSAAMSDDGCDQRLPFARLIGWRCDLRSRRQPVGDCADARFQHRKAWRVRHRFVAPMKLLRICEATSAVSSDAMRGDNHRRSPPGECQLIENDSDCSPERSRTGVTDTTPPSCGTRWDWWRRALMRIPVAALEGEAVRSPQRRACRAPPTS